MVRPGPWLWRQCAQFHTSGLFGKPGLHLLVVPQVVRLSQLKNSAAPVLCHQ